VVIRSRSPGGHVVHVQAASWRETKANVADCVFDLRQDESDTVAIQFFPADPEAAAALATVATVRSARIQAERDAVRRAARLLVDQGWSTRDAGSALGLSHRRISQIVPRTPA
jgi:predicted DCC family thiol-disulfide oxidoreductase YuxK